MLVVDPLLKGKVVCLRESQIKFEGNSLELDSMSLSSFLLIMRTEYTSVSQSPTHLVDLYLVTSIALSSRFSKTSVFPSRLSARCRMTPSLEYTKLRLRFRMQRNCSIALDSEDQRSSPPRLSTSRVFSSSTRTISTLSSRTAKDSL